MSHQTAPLRARVPQRRTAPLRARAQSGTLDEPAPIPPYQPPAANQDAWSTAGKVALTPVLAIVGFFVGAIMGYIGGWLTVWPVAFISADLADHLATLLSWVGALGGVVVGGALPWHRTYPRAGLTNTVQLRGLLWYT